MGTATNIKPSTVDADGRAPTKKSTDWTRKHATAAGTFYLITFAASTPAAFYFLTPVLNDPGYVLGAGADTRVIVGCLLDAVNALACIGTAVAVYPVVRRHSESLALGFVTSRLFEAAVIMIGVVSLLAAVTLRQGAGGTGANEAALVTTSQALVAVKDYTFQFGPNMSAAVNALLFGTLLYRSRLIPRIIPALGLVGAPLLLAASVATVLGQTEQGSAWFVPGGALIIAWELSVGIYLIVKGFKPSPITTSTV